MADGTPIEWADATWNPITGCEVTSPGCKFCYAMKLAGGRLRDLPSRRGLTIDTRAGPVWSGGIHFNTEWLDQPLRWQRPRIIFVCAHGDLFYDRVPEDWIDQVLAVMRDAPRHRFMVLTKRGPEMRDYFRHALYPIPPNVWLGVSVEDRARLARLDDLRATPAAKRFVSFEPLLEDLGEVDLTGIDMAIVGGESGRADQRRPFNPAWARRLLADCRRSGTAFFMKQVDKVTPIPADLMIREVPT